MTHCGFRAALVIACAMALNPASGQSAPDAVAAPDFAQVSNPAPSVDSALAWDAVMKSATLSNGMTEAHYTFQVNNISTSDVVISNVVTSCHCTVARLPAQPWVLHPGEGGPIHATLDVEEQTGTLFKTMTVVTDLGNKMLFLQATVLPMTPEQMSAHQRSENRRIAVMDRRAIFSGDCARCHAEPTKGKLGAELYSTACGICHDAKPRDPSVPDLRGMPSVANPDFWRNWIRYGKPDSLMPAFAESQGGILSSNQIESLVTYLKSHPQKP